MKEYFDSYYPIFESIGVAFFGFDKLYNPIYPDHYLWHCKATRKHLKRRK